MMLQNGMCSSLSFTAHRTIIILLTYRAIPYGVFRDGRLLLDLVIN